METGKFESSDIAIVARSCVLPGAKGPEEFWSTCRNEKSAIKEISEARLIRSFVNFSNQSMIIQSTLACEIPDDEYSRLLQKHGLNKEQSNRLHTYTLDAVDQLLASMKPLPDAARKDLILGCMNPDSDYELQVMRDHSDLYYEDLAAAVGAGDKVRCATIRAKIDTAAKNVSEQISQTENGFFTSQSVARVAERFNLNGEHFLIDAACASSIVALEMALQRLKLNQADFVIAGGIESNLGYGAYVAFSSVGALAEKRSLPFDKNSQGIVQSEGAVLFGLKRLQDAVRDGDEIHGVIRAIAGSSDGRSASLFQPNVTGQTIVYKKIYDDDKALSYLEAHGTGTEVGDKTEMESITTFFKGHRFPVGSSKAIVGHAKGAAGAVGVLKSLFVIRDKIIPGSGYLVQPIFEGEDAPFINVKTEKIESSEPVRVGVNAFGFGGTNYHLLLEEYLPGAAINPSQEIPTSATVLIHESVIHLDHFSTDEFLNVEFPFRLPPKALSSIDKVQLAGLLASWNCIRSTGRIWNFLDTEKVNVISACTLFLDQIHSFIHRLAYENIQMLLEKDGSSAALCQDMKNYMESTIDKRYPGMSEDSATGVLNNVIAGRVCNAFDLFGKSYNIDKDLASGAVAMQIIENELRMNPRQMFILIDVKESHDQKHKKSKRESVTARILTSASFAIENELKATGQLNTNVKAGL